MTVNADPAGYQALLELAEQHGLSRPGTTDYRRTRSRSPPWLNAFGRPGVPRLGLSPRSITMPA
jgi:hypothetical protein